MIIWQSCERPKDECALYRVKLLRGVYPTFQGNKVTTRGLSQEEASSQHYLIWLQQQSPAVNVTVNCGLLVFHTYPWLAATPHEDTQATLAQEFKNCYSNSHKESNTDNAITSKKCMYLLISSWWQEITEAISRLLLSSAIHHAVYRNKVV